MSAIFSNRPVEWKVSGAPVPYLDAMSWMENRVRSVIDGTASECVWCLEHPPLYTGGTSADISDLVDPDRFDVFKTGRGGQYTYHGPGQRVAYVMLDLRTRSRDIALFVRHLEQWIIDSLAEFGVKAERRCGRVGVWVSHADGREDKIAAIGVRLKKWVSFHGIAINVDPDLSHYQGIVPCGIQEHGVTSLKALGTSVSMTELDQVLKTEFSKLFGPLQPAK